MKFIFLLIFECEIERENIHVIQIFEIKCRSQSVSYLNMNKNFSSITAYILYSDKIMCICSYLFTKSILGSIRKSLSVSTKFLCEIKCFEMFLSCCYCFTRNYISVNFTHVNKDEIKKFSTRIKNFLRYKSELVYVCKI